MVQLLLGVQCLQVEEVLLEQVNVRLQERLAKRLGTKHRGRKGMESTTNIRAARKKQSILTLTPGQTPGSLSAASSQETGSSDHLCCQQIHGGDILVGTWAYPCRAGSRGNRQAKLALERARDAEPSSLGSQAAQEGQGCSSGVSPKAPQHREQTRTQPRGALSLSQEPKQCHCPD